MTLTGDVRSLCGAVSAGEPGALEALADLLEEAGECVPFVVRGPCGPQTAFWFNGAYWDGADQSRREDAQTLPGWVFEYLSSWATPWELFRGVREAYLALAGALAEALKDGRDE